MRKPNIIAGPFTDEWAAFSVGHFLRIEGHRAHEAHQIGALCEGRPQ